MVSLLTKLLPNAIAWNTTINKQLRRFFGGLLGTENAAKSFLDRVWQDTDPAVTRELPAWERQFGLLSTSLTEAERRARLDAAWKALGGQDPRYIQDTLQANGFNVFVHEWWTPGTEPAVGVKQCVTPRNPLLYLRRQNVGQIFIVECGEAVAECGEVAAEAGNSIEPLGYPLVNRIRLTESDEVTLCGEALAQCGEPEAACGNFLTFRETFLVYAIPLDATKWPYFLYIGGQTFGGMAQVQSSRRDEFETLCLKICPLQQWLGILVEYT